MMRLSTSLQRIVGALALATSLSGSALAQGTQRTPGFPPGLAEARLIREMPEEIGVDEATLEKLAKLVEQLRAEADALQAKTLEGRNAVQVLLDEAKPDEEKLMAAVGAASGVARQTREHWVKGTLRIRALLTEEQLAKFMELREKAVKTRRQGKKRGGRPKVRR